VILFDDLSAAWKLPPGVGSAEAAAAFAQVTVCVGLAFVTVPDHVTAVVQPVSGNEFVTVIEATPSASCQYLHWSCCICD